MSVAERAVDVRAPARRDSRSRLASLGADGRTCRRVRRLGDRRQRAWRLRVVASERGGGADASATECRRARLTRAGPLVVASKPLDRRAGVVVAVVTPNSPATVAAVARRWRRGEVRRPTPRHRSWSGRNGISTPNPEPLPLSASVDDVRALVSFVPSHALPRARHRPSQGGTGRPSDFRTSSGRLLWRTSAPDGEEVEVHLAVGARAHAQVGDEDVSEDARGPAAWSSDAPLGRPSTRSRTNTGGWLAYLARIGRDVLDGLHARHDHRAAARWRARDRSSCDRRCRRLPNRVRPPS